MAGIAWVNGRLLAPEEAAISVLNRGFLYGEGLFETMRAYRGRVFRLRQHLERLGEGAGELDLRPPGPGLLTEAVNEAIAGSGLEEATVRLSVTPGLAGSSPTPTVVVLVRPLTLPPAERYSRGCRAVCVPAAQAAGTPLRRVKSLNYLDKLLAQRAAADAGADEAILVDPDGSVVEGAMRNVFAVMQSELVTPPASRGLLPGITRQAVLEVAERLDMRQGERDIRSAELSGAEECFLTSSIAEILPVASVDGRPMPAPVPGPKTRALTEGYRRLVAEELGLGEIGNGSG